MAAQHPARHPPRAEPHSLDVGRSNHSHRNASDALRQYDVILVRGENRILICMACPAFGRGDEPRAKLRSRVAHAECLDELTLLADPASAYHGQTEISNILEQSLRAEGSGVSTSTVVHADQPVDARVAPLQRPLPLRDIVIHDATYGMRTLRDPPGIAERRDE